MTKNEIIKFMNENPVFALATNDSTQPRVRYMMTSFADEENGITFCTGKAIDLYKQLCENPAVELCYLSGDQGMQVRVTATADDVLEAVELPPDLDASCLGSVPGRLAYDRIIGPSGFVRSARPERHGCWLQVWALVDRAAAKQWLDDHPDLPGRTDNGRPAARQGMLFDVAESATVAGF